MSGQVRIESDLDPDPSQAKMAEAEKELKLPASSRRRLRLVIGGRDVDAGNVRVRLHNKGRAAPPTRRAGDRRSKLR